MGILKTVTNPAIVAEKKKLSELVAAVNNNMLENKRLQESIKSAKKELEAEMETKASLVVENRKEVERLKSNKLKVADIEEKTSEVLSSLYEARKELSGCDKQILDKKKELKELESSYDLYINSVESAKKDMLNEFIAKFEKVKSLMS